MRGLGVLDTVAAKPVPRRGAQRRERASKRRKFMPKTAVTTLLSCESDALTFGASALRELQPSMVRGKAICLSCRQGVVWAI